MKFKQIISICLSFIILFAISCKNDDKTGSSDAGYTHQNHPPAGTYANGFHSSSAEVKINGSTCSITGKAYYSNQVYTDFNITVINWYQENGSTRAYAGSSSSDGEATINSPTTDYFQVEYNSANTTLRVDIRTNGNESYTTSYLSKQ